MNEFKTIGTEDQNVLCEVSNICSKHAANALSTMLSKSVQVTIPIMKSVDYKDALSVIGDEEKIVGAVLVKMSDEINGMFLLLYDIDFANSILEPLLGNHIESFVDLNEDETSAISEIGNIIIGSYVTSLANLTHCRIDMSIPHTTVNMLGGIMSVPMAIYGYETDELMYTQTEFIIDEKQYTNYLMMIPDVESMKRIIEKTGV